MKNLLTKTMQNRYFEFLVVWFLLFSVGLVLRFHYLLGPHLFIDGDEALFGIMASDILHFKKMSFYFYGQRYGLAIFEVLSVAFFMLFLGTNSVYALKFGGFLLFALMLTFLYKLLRKAKVSYWQIILTLLILLVFPPWFLLAMKSHGGYITAFCCLSIILYLLYNNVAKQYTWWLVCLFFAIGFWGQIMIMLVVVPLITFKAFRQLSFLQMIKYIGVCILFGTILYMPALLNKNYWQPNVFDGINDLFFQKSFQKLPSIFTSKYLYEVYFKTGIIEQLITFGILAFFVFAAIGNLIFYRSVKHSFLFWSIWLGGWLAFVPIVFTRLGSGRYYLGFAAAILLIYCIVFMQLAHKKWLFAGLGVLYFGLFAFNLPSYKTDPAYWLDKEQNDLALNNELFQVLKSLNIYHVYCYHPLETWRINYLTDGKISARYYFENDRINRFIEKVNQCYLDPDCKVAYVGFYGNCINVKNTKEFLEKAIHIEDRYVIIPEPTDTFLIKAKMELPKVQRERESDGT